MKVVNLPLLFLLWILLYFLSPWNMLLCAKGFTHEAFKVNWEFYF